MQNAIVHCSRIVKVADDIDLDLFALLGCSLQTGAGAILHALDVQPGKTVTILESVQ